MKTITRKEAKKQGLKRYFTGKPCKRGHVCERYVSVRSCIRCQNNFCREWYKNNKERAQENSHNWAINNPERRQEISHNWVINNKEYKKNLNIEWCKNNKERKKETSARWYKNNKKRKKITGIAWHEKNIKREKETAARWYKNNPEKVAAKTARRRASNLQATPTWYESEKEFIEFIYKCSKERSKSTGILYHVDHIIPLQHDLVCGLECTANLQIITAKENLKKHNKFKGE